MKLILAAALVAVLAASASAALTQNEYRTMFNDFKSTHGRDYASIREELTKFETFQANVDFIMAHNAKESSFKVAVNQFADMTNEEFRAVMLSPIKTNPFGADASRVAPITNVELPDSVDWRQKGAVTHVKNQGQCGSCWSFSATGTAEGAYKIAGNSLTTASEQELVSCDTSQNAGCNGGVPEYALDWIIANKGIETEDGYPYEAADSPCNKDASKNVLTITSYQNVVQGSEQSLQEQIVLGPVSVAIDASQSSFQFYSSGVYNEPACTDQLDHGVLAVGLGTLNGDEYYTVKNSWGDSWGMDGYILMARNNNDMCGIALMSVRAI